MKTVYDVIKPLDDIVHNLEMLEMRLHMGHQDMLTQEELKDMIISVSKTIDNCSRDIIDYANSKDQEIDQLSEGGYLWK